MTFTTFKNSKILKAIMVTTIAGVLVCAPAGAKNITIKMGNVDSPFKMSLSETNGEFASTDIKCQAFKKIVESASGGRIQVKIFPAGQLGGECRIATGQGQCGDGIGDLGRILHKLIVVDGHLVLESRCCGLDKSQSFLKERQVAWLVCRDARAFQEPSLRQTIVQGTDVSC